MFRRKKEDEEMKEEEIEEPEQLPPQVPNIQPDRYFLMVVNDGESQETVVIKSANILFALSKFAKEYNDVCGEWLGLNISIEEVESIE